MLWAGHCLEKKFGMGILQCLSSGSSPFVLGCNLFLWAKLPLIVLEEKKQKTSLTGRDLFERNQIPSIISFLERNFKV